MRLLEVGTPVVLLVGIDAACVHAIERSLVEEPTTSPSTTTGDGGDDLGESLRDGRVREFLHSATTRRIDAIASPLRRRGDPDGDGGAVRRRMRLISLVVGDTEGGTERSPVALAVSLSDAVVVCLSRGDGTAHDTTLTVTESSSSSSSSLSSLLALDLIRRVLLDNRGTLVSAVSVAVVEDSRRPTRPPPSIVCSSVSLWTDCPPWIRALEWCKPIAVELSGRDRVSPGGAAKSATASAAEEYARWWEDVFDEMLGLDPFPRSTTSPTSAAASRRTWLDSIVPFRCGCIAPRTPTSTSTATATATATPTATPTATTTTTVHNRAERKKHRHIPCTTGLDCESSCGENCAGGGCSIM